MEAREWLNDFQIGVDIWEKKYRHNGESFDEWLDRVSGGNPDVRQIIIDKKFLFAGRILSGRGVTDRKITYSNCYVVAPPEDNLESIFDTAKNIARTYSYGGGCGIDIGKLRPLTAKVNNAAKETTGSVSFMELYNLTTGLIGMKNRRGALMISIPCTHPDLEEFISIKSDLTKLNSANISIRVNKEFMEAVKNRESFTLSFYVEDTGETISKEVNAYDIFYKLSQMNWDNGEPGIIFWDRIEGWHLMSEHPEFEYAGLNPCNPYMCRA